MENDVIYHDEMFCLDEIRLKFKDMGLDWLSAGQANRKLKQLLSASSVSLLPRLQEAFDHYTTLLGITDLYQVDKQTLLDERVKYSYMIKYSSICKSIIEKGIHYALSSGCRWSRVYAYHSDWTK